MIIMSLFILPHLINFIRGSEAIVNWYQILEINYIIAKNSIISNSKSTILTYKLASNERNLSVQLRFLGEKFQRFSNSHL